MSACPDPQPIAEFLDLGRSILQAQMTHVEALRDASPDVEDVLANARRIWSDDRAWLWLLRHNAVLGDAPLDLLVRGEAAAVRVLLGRIEHGIAA